MAATACYATKIQLKVPYALKKIQKFMEKTYCNQDQNLLYKADHAINAPKQQKVSVSCSRQACTK